MNAKEVVEDWLARTQSDLRWFEGPLQAAMIIRLWGYEVAGYMDKPTYDHKDTSFLDLYVYLVTGMVSHNGVLENPHVIGE